MPKHGAQNIETSCRNMVLKIQRLCAETSCSKEITCWKKFRHYAQNAECSYNICSRQKRSYMQQFRALRFYGCRTSKLTVAAGQQTISNQLYCMSNHCNKIC